MPKIPKGAIIAVKKCLAIKPFEKVLIVTDPQLFDTAEVLDKAVQMTGAESIVIVMPIRKKHGDEPPKPVEHAMRASDVIIAPTTYSLTHTQACLRAREAGARIASMPAVTKEELKHGAMLADYNKIERTTRKVMAYMNQALEIEITTLAGTELRFSTKGRKARADTGILHKPGDMGNLPAGEAFVAPIEGTAKGHVVVDGSMINFLSGRLEMNVEKGKVTEIRGKHASKLIEILECVGEKAYNLAEFGIGTNPKACLIGKLEDEKVLGTCHIALGDNSTFGGKVKAGVHLDGIILKPTVKLDGKILMKDGKLKF